jgi:hypothetical protein
MSDDLNNKCKADRDRINVNETHEVRYRTKELGISEARLKDVVGTDGPMVKDVKRALGKD